MNNEMQNQRNNNVAAQKKPKKNNTMLIVGIIAGVAVLAIVLILVFGLVGKLHNGGGNNEFTDSGLENDTNTNNGVFTSEDGATIKIFFKTDENMFFSIASTTYSLNSYAKFSNNKAAYEFFGDSIDFEFTKEGIKVTATKEGISGDYKKQSAYDFNAYFADYYGDVNLAVNFNGEFKDGEDKVIRMYQFNKENVRVSFKSGLESSDLMFKIVDDETLHCKFFSDDMTIKYSKDGLVITNTNKDTDYFIAGNYTKTKDIKVSDIINAFVEE